MATPALGRARGRLPTIARRGKQSTGLAPRPVKLPAWTVARKRSIWADLGPGPFLYAGKRASRPEYIVLMMLNRLGWRPSFQVDILGGRRVPGGQILDIVIEDAPMPVYISVKGIYHRTAAARAEDAYEEALVRSLLSNVKVLEIWEQDIEQENWLENFLRREVGVRG